MGNTIIKINCLDQRLILSSTPLIASGGMNENIAEFDFCPLWDGFAKTAIFYRDETEKYYAIVNSENKCVIPWEVLQSDGKVFFGVYGVKGDVRRTTEILGYKIKLGAFDEKLKPSEPTPDIYSQYVNRIIEVENRVTPIEEFTIKPTPFELTGNPIQMQNFEGMPLKVVTAFEPKQSGSGEPSPENVRPISGHDALELNIGNGEQERKYSVQPDSTVYGGRMNWNTGILTVDTVLETVDGTETWLMDAGGIWTGENGNSFYTTLSQMGKLYTIPVCNTYKGIDRYAEGTFAENTVCIAGGGSQIEFVRTAFDSVETWKAFLSERYAAGTPVQIAYKLYESITIQLSPNDIAALDGVNNIFGDGEITVSGRKDILWLTSGLIECIKTLEKAVISLGGNV